VQVTLGSYPAACCVSILCSLYLIWREFIEQIINRCMEYALGLEKFVKGASPTAGSSIIRKVQRAIKDAKRGDTYDIDQSDAGLKGCENRDDIETDEDDDIDTGDACGKALALVKQVFFCGT
jgi:hypothetical protein